MNEAKRNLRLQEAAVKRSVIVAGDRIGRLVASEYAPFKNAKGHTIRAWRCVCDCSNTKVIREGHLKTGATQSCGCMLSDCSRVRSTVHGQAIHGSRPDEYVIWQAMIRRCETPGHIGYSRYGAKGVTVCERWRSDFEAFLADVGPRPSKHHSLDRYPDNSGDYEPGNVRWALWIEQAENRRHTIWVDYEGERMPLARATERAGVKYMAVYSRMHKGMAFETAMSAARAQVRRAA